MALAQVVYNISNDSDFAAQWNSDPQSALEKKGWKLSKEELDFLSQGMRQNARRVNLSEVIALAGSWN